MTQLQAVSSPTIVIRPSRGWVPIDLRQLWFFRELLYYLVWREIKVRYKQTVMGFTWAIIQPVFMMVIFTLFFRKLTTMPSEGLPYPLFTFTALLPWTLFAEGISRSANSVVQDANLVQKVYFPRLVMPLSGTLSPLIDFAIAFLVLVVMMLFYGFTPTTRIFWLPAFILLAQVTSLGVGLWLSAINAQYRDVRYAIPFLVQIWLFASPVVYPSSILGERWQAIYGINPMAGVIEGFRWALLGTAPPGSLLVVSVVIAIATLVSGAFYFRRMERTFADVV